MEAALAHSADAVEAVATLPVEGLPGGALKLAAGELQRQIDLLTVQQARVLHEAQRTEAWKGTGARNMADWLAGATKCSYAAARRRQALGAAMAESPELEQAVARGELSPDTAGQLVDAVTKPPAGANPADLVEACKGATPTEARAAADVWRQTYREETEEEAEERRHASRSLRATPALDGQITISVTAPTLHARQILSVCAYLGGKPDENDRRTTAQRMCDGLIMLADAYAKGEVRGGREKPTILITIDLESMTGRSDEPGLTSHGERVPAHVVRMLAEHAHLRRVLRVGSQVLDLGREVRYASREQYLALVARDGGCRVEGCHIPPEWCDVDHLVPFEEGGATDLDNLVLWCRHHHVEKHRPGARTIGDVHHLRLQFADGTVVACPPKRSRPRAAAA